MKGVLLAGGLGTRLHPLTRVTNKHLLPVFDRPMIYYPLQALLNAGVRDIMLVTGGNNAGDFLRLLGNGKDFGLKHLNYTYQEGEGGIAAALALAEHFVDRDRVCVVLGDNIIEGNFRASAEVAEKTSKQTYYIRPDGPGLAATGGGGAAREGCGEDLSRQRPTDGDRGRR